MLDPYHRIKHVAEEELPKCPKCKTGLQRPGVVWFGEELDEGMIEHINDWITKDKIVWFRTLHFSDLAKRQDGLSTSFSLIMTNTYCRT